jgi:hypothetical protein
MYNLKMIDMVFLGAAWKFYNTLQATQTGSIRIFYRFFSSFVFGPSLVILGDLRV